MKKITLGLMLAASTSLFGTEIYTFGCGITKSGFLNKMNSAYSKASGISVTIPSRGGAIKAMKLADAGKVAIASGCRPALPELSVSSNHVAWGAIVPIVNKAVSLDSITTQQFKDILVGKIKNYKDIGGPDLPIILYTRKGKISGVGYSTRALLFHNGDQSYSKDAKKKKSSGPIRKAVSRDKSGFGVDDISSARKNKKIKILKVDGLSATYENITSGKYPLYRPFYLYLNPKSVEGKKYLDYALSAEGQAVIKKNGTVNLADGKNLSVAYLPKK